MISVNEAGGRGGKARAKNMTKKERSEAARKAAKTRWYLNPKKGYKSQASIKSKEIFGKEKENDS